MFRVHETTVFTNATGPPKVVKLSQKAALLDLTWAREVDLAGVWVVDSGRIMEGLWEDYGRIGFELILAPENAKSTLLMPK